MNSPPPKNPERDQLAALLRRRAKMKALRPISFAQQRFWLLDQLSDNNDSYNVPAVVLLRGKLSLPQLQRALNAIVARHESLRSIYHLEEDGSILQRILPELRFEIPVIDVVGASDVQVQSQLKQLTSASFSLTKGPLLRCAVLKKSENEHLLSLTMHHSISDGWSIANLTQELAISYEAFGREMEPPLPELRIQYSDYATWQRERVEDGSYEEHAKYWQSQFNELPDPLELPMDHVRTNGPMRGARAGFHVSAELTERLRSLGRTHGATLYMVLLASWSSFLGRLSNQRDVIVGSPVAGRSRPELEPLIGCFVNTIALRINWDDQANFEQLIKQARDTALDAFAHQDYPFDRVIESLKLPRELGSNPLFRVMFALQNIRHPQLRLGDLEVELIETENESAKFDLTMALFEHADGSLVGSWEYAADLFSQETIEYWQKLYTRWLEEITSDCTQPLSKVDWLWQQEQLRIESWSRGANVPFDNQPTVDQRFWEIANREPDSIAIQTDDQQLSYSQLRARAEVAATRLQQAGVCEGDTVAIQSERSVNWIVGLLGILRAGGIYLPLDPKGNAQSNRFILEDGQPRLLLHGSGELSADLPLPVLALADISSSAQTNTDAVASSDSNAQATASLKVHARRGTDALYLMYTSGSTGRPKGSWVRHEGVINLVNSPSYLDLPGLKSAGDLRMSHLSNPAFDASTFEVWAPLLNGGTLIVIDHSTAMDPATLRAAFTRHDVRICLMTTAHVNFLGQTHPQIYAGLHALLAGGEVLQSIVAKKIRTACPGLSLLNVYGPTEAACFCSVHQACAGDDHEPRVPIGKPIQNVCTFIVDEHMALQPVGVAGELIIGGSGVGSGYLNRPDDQRRFFQSDRFPGVRLYRTGDYARWNRQGKLDFLGRIDRQVKLRGFRIELTAIEMLCLEVEGVDEAVVVLRKEGNVDCLVCYLGITVDQLSELVANVRAHLAGRLAPAMVPNIFVPLSSLPKTNNGKVDLKNLPAPTDEQRGVSDGPLVTPTQIMLADIWKSVLDVQQVGRHDRFFDIGGHSLASIRLVSQISQTWSIDLPLKTVWLKPALGELADEIDRLIAAGARSQPIQALSQTIAPLSLAQESIWKAELLSSQLGLYNVGVATNILGNLNVEALRSAIENILKRHSILRSRILLQDNVPVQVSTDDLAMDWAYEDVSSLRNDERSKQLAAIAHRVQRVPFNLARGPQLRIALARLDENTHRLNLGFHHLHVDGWSMDVFFEELSSQYKAICAGVESSLPPLRVQYSDYATWQRERVADGSYEEHAQYWQSQFNELPDPLELPMDHVRTNGPMRGARAGFHVSAELTERLRSLGRNHGATLYMVLLASWSSFLGRLSNQRDVIVGSPVAGRSRPELEPLIGCFVNTIALRINWDDQANFEQLIKQVRDTALDAFAHQDYPFDRVIESLKLPRDLGSNPLFRVMFALQTTRHSQMRLGDLEVELIETENESAKFDLTMALFEHADGSLVGSWEYAAGLFSQDTIEYWQKLYIRWLEEITSDCTQSLSKVDWLWQQEQLRIESWSHGVNVPFDNQRTVDQLFWEVASRESDTIAIQTDGLQLTYGDLQARAELAAAKLLQAGVSEGDIVAIQSERSVEWIVGLLGILRAGGIYLPLDPKGNAQSNRYILEDGQPRLLLHGSGELSADLPLPVLSLAEIANSVQTDADANSNPSLKLHARRGMDPLYLMYTSGSTGRPKGSWVRHEGVINLVNSPSYLDIPTLKAAGDLRVSHLSNPAFDASTFEIWTPLLNGGTLILIDHATMMDPVTLQDAFDKHAVRATFMTTACFNQIAKQRPEAFRSLRTMLFGGEAANSECTNLVRTALPKLKLVNMYGPTECTVFTTSFEVPADWNFAGSATLPLGEPLQNTQVTILDDNGQAQPAGVYGELCVTGPGVATGYLNSDELTAKHFVTLDPASKVTTYKTGDWARWTQAGKLEYKGRRDRQIKLRGFRIEQEAIEVAIREAAAVTDVLVVVDKVDFDDRLLAFVLSDVELDDAEVVRLRSALRQRLPDYMVPARVISSTKWPLNANGKVDVKALLKTAQQSSQQPATAKVASANHDSLVAQMQSMWSECLGLPSVGTNDNFFELGGHSLLVMQLASKLSLHLGRTVSPVSIITHPTIDELVNHLTGDNAELDVGTPGVAPPVKPLLQPHVLPAATTAEALKDTEYLRFVETPLEELVEQGAMGTVDSIAIGYLPESLRTTLVAAGAEGVLEMFDEPIVSSITDTAFGRVAAIIVPIWGVELYERSEQLATSVLKACQMGQRLGASHASLTGLIPSATDGGRKVAKLLNEHQVDVQITTGHATTASAVLTNVLGLCAEAGRSLSDEHAAFLGLGSIGSSTLKLMIAQQYWPASLLLVDVPSKAQSMAQLKEELRAMGYHGEVSILTTTGDAPAEVYECTLIVGATNFPNTLKVDLLKAGTLVVDDSGPHCFDVAEGVARMNQKADVLLIEGGLLQMPKPSQQVRYMPAILASMLPGISFQHSLSHDPWTMTGCILSGLISTDRFQRTCVMGTPNDSQLSEHFEFIRRNGLSAAPLHCQGTDITQRVLRLFKHQNRS